MHTTWFFHCQAKISKVAINEISKLHKREVSSTLQLKALSRVSVVHYNNVTHRQCKHAILQHQTQLKPKRGWQGDIIRGTTPFKRRRASARKFASQGQRQVSNSIEPDWCRMICTVIDCSIFNRLRLSFAKRHARHRLVRLHVTIILVNYLLQVGVQSPSLHKQKLLLFDGSSDGHNPLFP